MTKIRIKNRCKASNFSAYLTKENIVEAMMSGHPDDGDPYYARIHPGQILRLNSYLRDDINNACYFRSHKVIKTTISRAYVELKYCEYLEPEASFFLFLKCYHWPESYHYSNAELAAYENGVKPSFVYDILNDSWFEIDESYKVIKNIECMAFKPVNKTKTFFLRDVVSTNGRQILRVIKDCISNS